MRVVKLDCNAPVHIVGMIVYSMTKRAYVLREVVVEIDM